MKKTIICHSFPAWDTPYVKSTLELLKHLSAEYRVIFIDYHYTWKDLFSHPNAPKKRMLGIDPRWHIVNTAYGEIEIYNTPPVLPINWINSMWLFRLLAGFNGWLIKGTIKRILKRVDPENTILLNALNPVYGHFTHKAWKVSKSIYYCYDELKGTPWSKKWGPTYEEKYLKQVDQVIATSPKLAETKNALNANVGLVPNGVNLDLFVDAPVEKTKNKVIGYVGAIDDRIDIDLVAHMARILPEYEFRFIGPLKSAEAIERWKMLPNIVCPGAKAQAELPALIAEMDCCLIPFVKNELTEAIYPLKINEYLAMGKPVVSTGFSDLSDFYSYISIADDAKSMLKAIQRELKGNNRMRIQKRIKFAAMNSWANRASQLAAFLEKAA